jgi:prefoldin subunit 5
MKPAACLTILACLVVLLAAHRGLAQDREVAISGQEIVERLSRIEEAQKGIDQRLAALEKRIDGLERRIDDGLKGLEQKIDQRMGEIRDFMLWGFGVTFAGIFALVGFVLWDRRTALAPAVRRIEDLQDREQRLESALRDYAQGKSDLATSLRKSGLL